MLWGIKTKNTQVVNFNDEQLSRIVPDKQSTKESSQSITLNIKKPITKTIEELIRNLHQYQAFSKYVDLNCLKKNPTAQFKRYRECIYFGELKQNKKEGKGIMLYTNGRIYQGEWKNNSKQGKGFEKFSNSSVYDGAYLRGKPHGYGKYEWENGQIYQGEWIDGLKSGSGIWRGSKGDSYIGQWKNGKADGYGVHTWINGNRYEGQFVQCLKHGQGIQKFSNGDIYKGSYVNGRPHGYGEYFWSDGSSYKGEFKEGLRNGKGTWRKSHDLITDIYQGQFVDQKKEGYGIFTWANGSKYMGTFASDLRQGYGEMYWSDGNVYKGEWNNGAQVEEIEDPVQINFQLSSYSQDLMACSVPYDPTNQQNIELPNPEQSFDFRQFEQPNHPQIVQFKKFRARGMLNRSKNKCQTSLAQIGGSFRISNNFITEAVPLNKNIKSSSKMSKRPSRLSFFNGFSYQSTNLDSSRGRIIHSQSTSQRKAITVYPNNNSRLEYRSTKHIPIKNFQGVEFRQETSQQFLSSNSKSNNKIKPRVIKSSNGVRSAYNKNNHDMESFWKEFRLQKNAILGRNHENDNQEVKWFTRSRNELKYN